MYQPLDQPQFPPPIPQPKMKFGPVALGNLVFVLLFVGLGTVARQDVGYIGAGLMVMAQGVLGFLIGLGMVIAGKREWGLPMLLCGIVCCLIGFGVCVGGLGDMNFH